MPQELKVTCINKSNRTDIHEKIISIGGVNPDNTKWKQSQESAIRNIEDGKYSFYVISNGIKTKCNCSQKHIWSQIPENTSRQYHK